MAIHNTIVSLEEILKKKGIGPEGSKSLNKEELDFVDVHYQNSKVSLTTKATLLTALLLLEPNEFESHWLTKVKKNPNQFLPHELLPFLQISDSNDLQNSILKLIRKEELDEGECLLCMTALFNFEIPEYLKGAFLEGERLKRETFSENKFFFNYLWNKVNRVEIDTPFLIDICESYDGCLRSPNYCVFIAALLGSAGFPTIVHSVDHVAPKEGVTSHQIISAAGKLPFNTSIKVAEELMNNSIAWGYLDQSVYFPELYKLKQLRKEMVKRPFLATFEKLLQPIRAVQGNYIYTGYTHPHYRTELVKQLIAQNKICKALILKGAEGSTQLSLTKSTTGVNYNGNETIEVLHSPVNYGLPEPNFNQGYSTPSEIVRLGVQALNGERNEAYFNILYTALVIIDSFNLMDKEKALNLLTNNIMSGKALKFWNSGSL